MKNCYTEDAFQKSSRCLHQDECLLGYVSCVSAYASVHLLHPFVMEQLGRKKATNTACYVKLRDMTFRDINISDTTRTVALDESKTVDSVWHANGLHSFMDVWSGMRRRR